MVYNFYDFYEHYLYIVKWEKNQNCKQIKQIQKNENTYISLLFPPEQFQCMYGDGIGHYFSICNPELYV